MAKKIFIGVGHGGSDPGAVGYVREADANLTIALELKKILEANGFEVAMSRTKNENDPLTEEIKEANTFKPDFAIDVHNNAGGGDGLEVYVQTGSYKSVSRAVGQLMEKRVVKLAGQNSRGVKTRKNTYGTDYYGFLREVNAPAVIVEGFFVDNKNDAAEFDTEVEQKKLAKGYAQGIIEYFGVQKKSTTTATVKYRVQAGAFAKKANATARVNKLKNAGFDACIIIEDNKYKVQVGAYSVKENAQNALKRLKDAGFEAIIVSL